LSRYGLNKTAHAIRRRGSKPVGVDETLTAEAPAGEPRTAALQPVSTPRVPESG